MSGNAVDELVLSPESLRQLAVAVVDELERRQANTHGCELLDAAALARLLGCSRDWVYDHADELGAIRLGDGPKPRLRFNLERAIAAAASMADDTSAAPPAPVPIRRRLELDAGQPAVRAVDIRAIEKTPRRTRQRPRGRHQGEAP